MSKIVVVIDMQKDFIAGPLGTSEAVEAEKSLKEYLSALDPKEDYVIFTKDTHFGDYKDTQEWQRLPVKHCIAGTSGWEIPKELIDPICDKMQRRFCVVNKCYFGSNEILDGAINNFVNDWDKKGYIDEIIFCGLRTDICVIVNALVQKTNYPEIPMSILAKCCAGTTPEKHEAALKVLESCQFNIIKE